MSEPQLPDAKTALGAGVIPLEPGRTRYTLASGRIADVRAGKGKDLRHAGRMVGESQDGILYEFALIAIKVLIDGRPITLEEVDEMSDLEASELLAVSRGKVPSDKEKEEAKAKAAATPSAQAPSGDTASSPSST